MAIMREDLVIRSGYKISIYNLFLRSLIQVQLDFTPGIEVQRCLLNRLVVQGVDGQPHILNEENILEERPHSVPLYRAPE